MNKPDIKSRLTKLPATAAAAIAAAAIAGAAMTACVAEPWEYCPPRLLISTDHEVEMYGPVDATRAQSRARSVEDWYHGCIDTVAVYIFDENERFVTLWKGGPYTPGVEYEIPLREICLPEGVYTFVAWTNLDADHSCNITDDELAAGTGDYRLDDFMVNFRHEDGTIHEDCEHRHFGIRERVNVANYSILDPRESTIILDPGVHKVNFMVVGVEPSKITGDSHSVAVTDRNLQHDFRNRVVPNGEPYRQTRALEDVTGLPGGPGNWHDYDPEAGATPPPGVDPTSGFSVLTASMHLMQIHDLSKTGFEIRHDRAADPGERVLFRYDDIVALIQLVYSSNEQKVNFEETLEFDIVISFVAESYVMLTINGWTYRLNETELGR
jgi:hypothetical protein